MVYYAVLNWCGEYQRVVEAVCDNIERAEELRDELSQSYAGIEIEEIQINEMLQL